MILNTIVVRTEFEGIHRWECAPEEVSFLRIPHRHIFHVEVQLEVFHDDREIEFILLKRKISAHIRQRSTGLTWNMGPMSCEMVARELRDVALKYAGGDKPRWCSVGVYEDGENGAVVDTNDTNGQSGPKETKAIVSGVAEAITMAEYQLASYKAIQQHESNKEAMMHWAVGLGEEAGEVLSVLKHKYYGGEYDVGDLIEELGDTLWHISALCTASGIDIEDVAKFNLAKLEHRYPEGRFSESRSLNRHKLKFRETPKAQEIIKSVNQKNANKEGCKDEEFQSSSYRTGVGIAQNDRYAIPYVFGPPSPSRQTIPGPLSKDVQRRQICNDGQWSSRRKPIKF